MIGQHNVKQSAVIGFETTMRCWYEEKEVWHKYIATSNCMHIPPTKVSIFTRTNKLVGIFSLNI